MIRLTRVLLGLLLPMLILGGCSLFNSDFDSVSHEAGQLLCGDGYANPDDIDMRVLCLGGALVVVSELAADRVTRYEQADATDVLGTIIALQSAINRIKDFENEDWFTAELFDAERLIYLAARSAATNRVTSILLPGIDVTNIRAAAGKGGKLSAIATDVERLISRVGTQQRTKAQAWASILERLAHNRTRVEAVAGVQ